MPIVMLKIGYTNPTYICVGTEAWETCSPSCCSTLFDQHFPRGWNSNVVSMVRTERLHQCDLGLWMAAGNDVCYS